MEDFSTPPTSMEDFKSVIQPSVFVSVSEKDFTLVIQPSVSTILSATSVSTCSASAALHATVSLPGSLAIRTRAFKNTQRFQCDKCERKFSKKYDKQT